MKFHRADRSNAKVGLCFTANILYFKLSQHTFFHIKGKILFINVSVTLKHWKGNARVKRTYHTPLPELLKSLFTYKLHDIIQHDTNTAKGSRPYGSVFHTPLFLT
jgi:hypothetical protein